MSKEVILYSAGPDSHIAWYYLEKKPDLLYISHNCRYDQKQLNALERIKEIEGSNFNVTVDKSIDLSRWEHEDAHLPLRNLFLVQIAALYGYDKIWLIVQRGETSIPDRSERFMDEVSRSLSDQLERNIVVCSPFLDMTKQDMVEWYVRNWGKIKSLKATVSCFHPSKERCGECPACFRRWIAFSNAGIIEKYSKNLLDWPGTKEYMEKMLEGKYEERRATQTLNFLRQKMM